MNSVCAGIVLYNPNIDRLKLNLDSIIDQVSIVFLQDNGSDNINDINCLLNSYSNVQLLRSSTNKGIAWALNRLCEKAIEYGTNWILTLDQDSVSPSNIIEGLYRNTSKECTGIICPQIVDVNAGIINEGNAGVESVKECITSGSLLNLKAWESINGFDEVMFIDNVDFEFCYRLRETGWNIYKDNRVKLTHEIGNIQIRRFFCFKVIVKNHNEFRKYYIARNTIYFARKNTQKMIKANLQVIKQVLIVILYEKKKSQKISKILKGVKDGYKIKIDKHSSNIEGEKC